MVNQQGEETMKPTRVVVIDDGPEGLKAYLGTLDGTGTVYFTRCGDGGCPVTQAAPSELPADGWVESVGGDELHVDVENVRISLDDGRIKWDVSCDWFEVSPQPLSPDEA
jgi:hypothetical protein